MFDTADYHFKTDSDTYVNIPNLFNIINNQLDFMSHTIGNQIYAGVLSFNAPVFREGKLGLSKTFFPNDTFTRFALGEGYLLSNQLVKCMSKQLDAGVAPNPLKFPLEDVYIGLLSQYCSPTCVQLGTNIMIPWYVWGNICIVDCVYVLLCVLWIVCITILFYLLSNLTIYLPLSHTIYICHDIGC